MSTESISPLRKCTKCDVEFPATAEYFARQKNGKYGLSSWCRNCRNVYSAAHYLTNHDEIRAYNNAHYVHRDRREYYSSPEQKERCRIKQHNRRAVMLANGVDKITKADYEAVLQAHTNKRGQIICAWCGKPVGEEWHYDHWIPLDKGGKHEAGNIRAMHGWTGNKCNLKKGATHPFKFGKLI